MIYEAMRFMAGPYVCRVMDYCLQYQNIFNILLVTGAFAYLAHKRTKKNIQHP